MFQLLSIAKCDPVGEKLEYVFSASLQLKVLSCPEILTQIKISKPICHPCQQRIQKLFFINLFFEYTNNQELISAFLKSHETKTKYLRNCCCSSKHEALKNSKTNKDRVALSYFNQYKCLRLI